MKSVLAVVVVGLALSSCGDRRCSLEPSPGLCSASITGYYFDAKKGACAEFTWGGCTVGVRPFATLAECQQTCE